MRTIKLLATVLAIVTVLAAAYVSVSLNYQRYQAEVAYMSTITHDQAMDMCEDLGLVYNYEAEGYTTAEFCIHPKAN